MDSEGDIFATAEAELRTLDTEGFDNHVALVAFATDEAAGLMEDAELPGVRGPEVRRPEEVTGDVTSLLQGHIRLPIDRSEWIETELTADPTIDSQFLNVSNEASLAIVVGRSQYRAETLRSDHFDLVRTLDPNARIVRRSPLLVDGKFALLQEIEAEVDGYEFVYQCLYYSDSSGFLQLTFFTATNLAEEYRQIFERFFSGIRIGGR